MRADPTGEPAPGPSFLVPETEEEALVALAERDSLAVGGGTSLGVLLRSGLLAPSRLVYLGRIPGLRGVGTRSSSLEIGATTTLRELARHSEVRAAAPALAHAAACVGNPRVRAMATVGGAVAHGDPRQDLPPVLIAFGGELNISGPRGRRAAPLASFYRGFMETELAENELITSVSLRLRPRMHSCYVRFTPDSADDYPTVSVAAVIETDDSGVVTAASVAVGGAAPVALLAAEAGQCLLGRRPCPETFAGAGRAAAAACRPVQDGRGSVAYKLAMVEEITGRALAGCMGNSPQEEE